MTIQRKPKKRARTKRTLPDAARPYMWVKGQSGNPKGRPPGTFSLAGRLKSQLEDPASSSTIVETKATELGLDPEKTDIASVLTASLLQEALNGNGQLLKEILTRIDGVIVDPAPLPGSDIEEDPHMNEKELETRVLRAIKRRADHE
ncbi:MAG: hypothetical protein GY841_20055 [FCB group bacterium]|nr:hypothetical protein [FCB group bacterium]